MPLRRSSENTWKKIHESNTYEIQKINERHIAVISESTVLQEYISRSWMGMMWACRHDSRKNFCFSSPIVISTSSGHSRFWSTLMGKNSENSISLSVPKRSARQKSFFSQWITPRCSSEQMYYEDFGIEKSMENLKIMIFIRVFFSHESSDTIFQKTSIYIEFMRIMWIISDHGGHWNFTNAKWKI